MMPRRPRNQLLLPPGRKAGVLREATSERKAREKVAARCAPFKADHEVIKSTHWDELADSAWHRNRRSRFRYTLDQDGIGSCAGESAAGAKAALDERQNLPEIVYNPWFIYQTTSGGRDNGSVIGDNAEFIRDKGVCPEEVWPRSKGWRAEPSAEAKRIAKLFRITGFFFIETIEEFVSALLQGFDIHAGYTGHAIVFDRYLKRRLVEYKNSWNEDWGDDGFGSLSLSKVYFPYGCYAYESVRIWTPEDWQPTLNQSSLSRAVNTFVYNCQDMYRPWSDHNERERDRRYLAATQGVTSA